MGGVKKRTGSDWISDTHGGKEESEGTEVLKTSMGRGTGKNGEPMEAYISIGRDSWCLGHGGRLPCVLWGRLKVTEFIE